MLWFGPRWDAPLTDDPTEERPAPIGTPCVFCSKPIEPGDRGVLILFTRLRPPYLDQYVSVEEPWHLGCFIRSVIPDERIVNDVLQRIEGGR